MPSIEEGLVEAPVQMKAIGARMAVEIRVPRDANALDQIEALRSVVRGLVDVVEGKPGYRADIVLQEVYFTT